MSFVQTSPQLGHGPLKVFKAPHLSDKYREKQRINESIYWKGLFGVHSCHFLNLTGQRASCKCMSITLNSAMGWMRSRSKPQFGNESCVIRQQFISVIVQFCRNEIDARGDVTNFYKSSTSSSSSLAVS